MRRRWVTWAVVAMLMVAGACDDDDGDGASVDAGEPSDQSIPPEGVEPVDLPSEKPEVVVPEGDAPTELVIDDLIEGDGDEAVPGASVEVHYVGVLFADGTEFDSSWDRGNTFRFSLGAGQVIQGWDQGVAGMKVGGRRRLVIPPDLAYGSTGAGGAIPPDATLVFVVDLIAVQAPPG